MSLRRWLAWQPFAFMLCLSAVVVTPLQAEDAKRSSTPAESEARLKRDIYFLASDACEGRGPTTAGLKKAGDYIAGEFKKAGLKPGNPDGTYFQNFTIAGATKDGPAKLVLKGPGGREITLKEGVHFNAMGLAAAGKVASAPLAFAGYGISNKTQNGPPFDDYADFDATGKVVVVLRDVPRTANKFLIPDARRGGFRTLGSINRKVGNAAEHGAAAVLIVNDADTASTGDDLYDFEFTAVGAGATQSAPDPDNAGRTKTVPVKIPALHIKRDVLDQMLFGVAGKHLTDIEADIDRDMKPQTLDLKGWTVRLEVKMKHDKLPLRNVIGVLEGKGPLANETVVVGSHYDHLGYGGAGGSLANLKKMAIHHGADDNGSGTTTVMELARRFGAMPDRQGRRMVFMTFSGEELGLLGSAHYAANPLIPLKDTVFMLNLDMVGRLFPSNDPQRDQLLTEGLGSGKGFEKLVDGWNKNYNFDLKKTAAAIPYSDHYSFYAKKVPVMFFWTGYHADYHRPTDTADKINVPGMRRITDLAQEVLTYFATLPERPEYQVVKSGGQAAPRRGGGPTIGFTPNYGDDDGTGVGVMAVTEGGAGDKAGLKVGDKIVEIGGKPVKTLTAYVEAMSTQKAGDTIEIVVLRAGKKVTLKVKLE